MFTFMPMPAGNNWKLILRDQINKIMFSGLYDHLDGIYAVICGNFEEPMIEAQNFLESARTLCPVTISAGTRALSSISIAISSVYLYFQLMSLSCLRFTLDRHVLNCPKRPTESLSIV